MVDPAAVSQYLREWLANIVGKQVGWGTLPTLGDSENLEVPYAILYDIASPKPQGSWALPEEDQETVFQVTSIGKSPIQAGWMRWEVRDAWIGREPSGVYVHQMAPGTFSLWGRESDGLGSIVPSGEHLFQATDIYRVRVSS
jgi:hypothetical protein